MARPHQQRQVRHAGRLRPALMQQQLQQAQLPSGAGQAPTVGADPYDFSADPILQRVQALGQRRQAEAEALSLQARRQLAIDSGDPSLAPDEETRQAAINNPFSSAALFREKAARAPRQLTEQDNQQNLFYSGAAGIHQSDLAKSLLGEQSDQQRSNREHLSAIQEALRGSLEGVQNDITSAQEDAAQRLQDRLGDTPVGGQGHGQHQGHHGQQQVQHSGGLQQAMLERLARRAHGQHRRVPHLPGGRP